MQVRDVKTPILEKAADRIRTDSSFQELRAGAEAFRQQNPWVEDSALFYALSHHRKELIGKAWWEWPEPIRSDIIPQTPMATLTFSATVCVAILAPVHQVYQPCPETRISS